MSELWVEVVRAGGRTGYPSPEDAALSGYTPNMHARVLRSVASDEPEIWIVHVDTEPSHPMRETCVRVDGAWHNVASD